MNRPLAILLLVLLLLPLLGHIVFFQLRKWQLRRDFKEKLEHELPRSALELIKIPLAWLTDEPDHFHQLDRKEFRLNEEMYDIVHQEQKGDTLWNYCLADYQETQLFTDLDAWTQQQHEQDPFQKGQSEQLERLLDSLFQAVNSPLIPALISLMALQWPPYYFGLPTGKMELVSPPPEVFS